MKKRILAVHDNNPEWLDFHKSILEKHMGFVVDTANDYDLVLRDFQAGKYDLVIIDARTNAREFLKRSGKSTAT